ncbi:MAG: serine--tRNA ligase [bacterium]|nr:serine--tRNA ligase [bacterium]MDZ4248420.1 serine--tRNA ligase [Patescibacteria group bacterium]
MIDIKIIKEDPQRIEAELKKRGIKLDVKKLTKLDEERRKFQQEFDKVRSEQKKVKTAVAGKQLKEKLKKIEGKLKVAQEDFDTLCEHLPNFSAEDVPVADDESGNETVREVGEQGIIEGAKPHYEIPGIKPLIDFERGAKVSGNRFWYLKGALVDLEFALIRYALDFYGKKGFTSMRPPTIVNRNAMIGTGFFPAESHEVYFVSSLEAEAEAHKAAKGDKEAAAEVIGRQDKYADRYLSGTAEVPLASYHAGEMLDELPVKYAGFAPAYRREAGSYSKDTKGIMRGHEFDKVELFVFSDPAKSWDVHEELQKDAEAFWNSLEVPFRVVNICTGDLGAPNAKKYDIEAWLPGADRYMEVASNSNDTDFQARRLKIKHQGKSGGKTGTELVHTLNNTAVAVGRAIIAITENQQDKDGNVEIPEVLRKYLSFSRIKADGTTE